jgi:DNA-binding beta-propeller fold protein YncE
MSLRIACGLLLTIAASAVAADTSVGTRQGRLIFLDIRGRVLAADPDGSGLKILLDQGTHGPDGVAVDVDSRHIYWTNMGKARENDGSIQRMDLDGRNVITLVPPGGTFTPKQLKLDKAGRKLYWCDREGMRVMRANLDGSSVETLVETGRGDADRRDPRHWCVGIAVDSDRGQIYWTQKGGDNAGLGVIRRAPIEIPPGRTAADRSDIETLYQSLPEPIDLELDPSSRMMYWTDRGDPPRGNTVNRAPMDLPPGHGPHDRPSPEILMTGFKEAIGIALDLRHHRMFVTDLGGNVHRARLDGSDSTILLSGQGTLTGIVYVDPTP